MVGGIGLGTLILMEFKTATKLDSTDALTEVTMVSFDGTVMRTRDSVAADTASVNSSLSKASQQVASLKSISFRFFFEVSLIVSAGFKVGAFTFTIHIHLPIILSTTASTWELL